MPGFVPIPTFVAEKLGISGDHLEDLGTYSMLHDIGKLKVPLHILAKPEKLTPEEFGVVKNHAQVRNGDPGGF